MRQADKGRVYLVQGQTQRASAGLLGLAYDVASTSGVEWIQNPGRGLQTTVELASQRDLATPFLARSDHVVRISVELVRADAPDGLVFPFDVLANVVREDTRTSDP